MDVRVHTEFVGRDIPQQDKLLKGNKMKIMIQDVFERKAIYSVLQVPAKGERVLFHSTAMTVIDVFWVLGEKDLDAVVSVE